MFIHYRTKGFVLKETEKGEADKLFLVFTKDFGKLEILGKGIRKMKSKLRAGIPLFSISEIEFIQGKTYKTLTDAILIKDFETIKKDLKRLQVAFRISEAFDRLIKEPEKDEAVWQLFNETFDTLNHWSLVIGHWSLIYYYFLWNLLSILGYQPELYKCLICGKKLKPENLYFCKEGGIICHSCYKKEGSRALKIDPNVVKILREILKRNLQNFLKLKIQKEHQKFLQEVSNFYLLAIEQGILGS